MAPVPHKLPAWTDAAAHALRDALDGDAAELARQVDAGIAELYRWDTAAGPCWLLHRVDHLADQRPELVLCCIQGRGAGEVMPLVLDAAARQGLAGVRFQSARRGAARFARRWGFAPVATLFYRALGGGHVVQ